MSSTLFRDLFQLALTGFILTVSAILPVAIPAVDVLVLNNGLSEISMTELAQEILVTLTAIAFFAVAWKDNHVRRGALLMGAFFSCLALREMDFLFDHIFHGAWKWLVLPIVGTAGWIVWRAPKASVAGVIQLLGGGPGVLLMAGMVLLVVYSRLIGMGALWEQLLDDGYVRVAKNFVEEGSELMAYGVITTAAFLRLGQTWSSTTSTEEALDQAPASVRTN